MPSRCCHVAGQRLTRTASLGTSAQLTDHDGRSWTMCPLLRICECVVTAVLGGLPPGSVPVVRVTRYGSGRWCVPFF
jgi:hypothetical protein